MKRFFRIPSYAQKLYHALSSRVVIFVALTGNILMFAGSALFFHFENETNPKVDTYLDALWWALTTVTTVGYGDIYPHTDAGRLIAAALMISGNFFFVSFGAILISIVFMQGERLTMKEHREVIAELARLRDLIEKR